MYRDINYHSYGYHKIVCANCGKQGHEFRSCREPIISFGIINIKILDDVNESLLIKDKFSTTQKTSYKILSKKYADLQYHLPTGVAIGDGGHGSSHDNRLLRSTCRLTGDKIYHYGDEHLEKFAYYKDKILFLMVSRKHSLGFIEFIRGKYDVYNMRSIMNLFEQMTEEEIKYVESHSYDHILYGFLNRNNESKETVLSRAYEGKYSNEYCEAKVKFEMLSNPTDNDKKHVLWSLSFYARNIKPRWSEIEWGFPKGRRDKKTEENMTCACREFEEETGYHKEDYFVLNKIKPIEEELIGTNGVHYKHIYYIAMTDYDHTVNNVNYDTYEIGDIKWFTYDQALKHIRPYHVEKKKILTQVYIFLLNYLIHSNYM